MNSVVTEPGLRITDAMDEIKTDHERNLALGYLAGALASLCNPQITSSITPERLASAFEDAVRYATT